jgi:hypothetical protein
MLEMKRATILTIAVIGALILAAAVIWVRIFV